MSDTFQPGDLVTGRRGLDHKMIANLADAADWGLWILRSSIMTVVEVPSGCWSTGGIGTAIVLNDDRLIEVFASDLQRLDGVDR